MIIINKCFNSIYNEIWVVVDDDNEHNHDNDLEQDQGPGEPQPEHAGGRALQEPALQHRQPGALQVGLSRFRGFCPFWWIRQWLLAFPTMYSFQKLFFRFFVRH